VREVSEAFILLHRTLSHPSGWNEVFANPLAWHDVTSEALATQNRAVEIVEDSFDAMRPCSRSSFCPRTIA
jgi:hypothetical protein